jgi:hypothetical protein
MAPREPAPSTPAISQAVVDVGDITPVISLPAEVSSDTSYDITANTAGTAVIHNGTLFVDAAGGASTPVVFQALDSDRVFLVPDGSAVTAGLPIASAHYRGFALTAEVSGATRLRLRTAPESARAQIEGSGAPFDCVLLDPRPTLSEDGTASNIGCIVPAEQSVIVGLAGVVALRFATVKGVLRLPIEAVAGTVKSASVYVKKDGKLAEVKIEVGATDGSMIQVISGLKKGDVVQIPSPSLIG